MKKLTGFLSLCFFLGALSSCKQGSGTTEVTTSSDSVVLENTIPELDTNNTEVDISSVSGLFTIESPSTVNWTGSKPGKSHVGTINISGGSLELTNGNITKGTFDIDMNTIQSTDLKPEDGKEKLENHLKSDDFFSAGQFPKATFVLGKSLTIKGNDKTRHHIKGDLTVKGITKPIEFDAYIIVSGNGTVLTATTPSFDINRIDFNAKYGSGVLNTVKDQIISDNIGLVVNIRAKKQ